MGFPNPYHRRRPWRQRAHENRWHDRSAQRSGRLLQRDACVCSRHPFANLGKMYKWLASAVLGLGGVALIFTFSRGAWIALVFAIVVLCFVQWRQRGISLKRPIAIFVVIALLYLPLHGVLSERLFGNDHGSAESRIPLNKLAFRMIADNPVLGVGANNFTSAMDQYATSEFRHEWLWAVHNKS